MFYDRLNGDSFIDLPDQPRHKYGKLIVIPDNASCHKSKKVTEFVGSYGGYMMPIYLVPYTPELKADRGAVEDDEKDRGRQAVRNRQGDEGLHVGHAGIRRDGPCQDEQLSFLATTAAGTRPHGRV